MRAIGSVTVNVLVVVVPAPAPPLLPTLCASCGLPVSASSTWCAPCFDRFDAEVSRA